MQSGAGKLKPLIRTLVAAALWLAAPAQAQPFLTLDANLEWDHTAPWFGGLSGIEVLPDGSQALIVTDKGTLIVVDLMRQADHLTGLGLRSYLPLKHSNGNPLRGKMRDAEGLAVHTTGEAFVTFEQQHRLAHLDPITQLTDPLPGAEAFDRFPNNAGLEALAIHPDGRLFMLSEDAEDDNAAIPLYVLDYDRWLILGQIPRDPIFSPVGADFDARGQLYLLERGTSLLGFRSRIRQIDVSTTPPTERTLLTTAPGFFDNLEGLSTWIDSQGRTRLTLVSDDNFLPVQKTQIVEFIVNE